MCVGVAHDNHIHHGGDGGGPRERTRSRVGDAAVRVIIHRQLDAATVIVENRVLAGVLAHGDVHSLARAQTDLAISLFNRAGGRHDATRTGRHDVAGRPARLWRRAGRWRRWRTGRAGGRRRAWWRVAVAEDVVRHVGAASCVPARCGELESSVIWRRIHEQRRPRRARAAVVILCQQRGAVRRKNLYQRVGRRLRAHVGEKGLAGAHPNVARDACGVVKDAARVRGARLRVRLGRWRRRRRRRRARRRWKRRARWRKRWRAERRWAGRRRARAHERRVGVCHVARIDVVASYVDRVHTGDGRHVDQERRAGAAVRAPVGVQGDHGAGRNAAHADDGVLPRECAQVYDERLCGAHGEVLRQRIVGREVAERHRVPRLHRPRRRAGRRSGRRRSGRRTRGRHRCAGTRNHIVDGRRAEGVEASRCDGDVGCFLAVHVHRLRQQAVAERTRGGVVVEGDCRSAREQLDDGVAHCRDITRGGAELLVRTQRHHARRQR